jgi:hypothetical protein
MFQHDMLEQVIQAADDIINIVDKDALAKFFGVNSASDEPEAVVDLLLCA